MIPHVRQTLMWLALLVSVGLTLGQSRGDYILVQRPMSWNKAQEFCRRHYVDLAVLSTEEQYFNLRNATDSKKASYWLGLQRRGLGNSWKWVNGEELGYKQWYNCHPEGDCVSLEAMLKEDQRLLPRLCDEPHMPVCQGPVSPQSVTVKSVGADQLSLSWNVSTFMQTTPHSYDVVICSHACEKLVYVYPGASAVMNIGISNLTSATDYFVKIAAFVVRPDNRTGGDVVLQDDPTTLQIKTGRLHEPNKFLCLFLKLLKLVSVAPPVWVLYKIFKADADDCGETDQGDTPVFITEE